MDVVTDDGTCDVLDVPSNRGAHRYLKVDSYYKFQANVGFGLSLPNPAPIGISAAANISRDMDKSSTVYYTHMTTGREVVKKPKLKESQLEKMLEEYRDQHSDDEEWCEHFLEKHNNVTHYISSITFGAMVYSKEKLTSSQLMAKVTIGASAPQGAKADGEAGGTRREQKHTLEVDTIGSFSPDGKKVEQSDMIFYECKPLTDLVDDEELRECLSAAIQKYVKKHHLKEGNYTTI